MMPASFFLAADPLGHVLDKPLYGSPVTMNMVTLLIAAALTVLLMNFAAKAIATGAESMGNERYITKGRFAQMIEVLVLYLRDNVVRPQLGHDANKFMPLLLSIFFFVLVCNLIGLVPLLDLQHVIGGLGWGDSHFAVVGGTPTGRIWLTGALATVAFVIWNAHGIIQNGVGGWLHHFMGGAPWYLAPIMVPVEILGTIVKPAALAIRLFANMTAGHVLLAVILGFTGGALKALGILGAPISFVALLAGVAIFFLELFVAFLQAYIFMFLTALFISQMSHHHHDDDAHAESYDKDHPASQDEAVVVTA